MTNNASEFLEILEKIFLNYLSSGFFVQYTVVLWFEELDEDNTMHGVQKKHFPLFSGNY